MSPRVSIIVPSYNHAQYLPARMDSCLGQTFTDFELLFLDDASTDDSLQVVQAWAEDPRVSIHPNEQNTGNPFIQWNRGIGMARGEYLWIAESDDFADPDFLQNLVARLDAHPNAVLASCRSCLTDSAGHDQGVYNAYQWFDDPARWQQDYDNDGRDELRRYLSFQNTLPNASALLIRRSALGDKLRAPETMRMAGDWWLWAALLLRGDLVHVAKPMNHFRQPHEQSQRSRTAASGQEIVEGFEVYRLVEREWPLDDSGRLWALKGLLRRWLSLASVQRLAPEGQAAIRQAFRSVQLDGWGARLRWRGQLALSRLAAPVLRLPGLRSLALRLKGSQPAEVGP